MISWICIQWTQVLKTSSGVNQTIYLWQGKVIFEVCLIEVSEVYKHPPFFIGVFHHYHISKPFRVYYLSNESCLQQLTCLLQDFFCRSPSKSLFFYLIGEKKELMFNWCEAISGLMLGMSGGLNEKLDS
jgi:hypothetical protein